MNPTTGVISGTLSYVSAGTHPVTATVSDGNLTSSQSFTWTVTNVNREPLLTVVAARTDAENATISLQVVATDPDGDPVTFSAIGLPPGLSINTSTGLIDGTLSYASAGTHVVTVLASDGDLVCGDTFNWTVTNVNREPLLTEVAPRTDAENATISLQVVATDPDGDPVTFSAIGLPAGLGINALTGLIDGTLSYASAGTHIVTVTASDGDLVCGYTFTWTVTNVNREPLLTAVAPRADAGEHDGHPRGDGNRSRRRCTDLHGDRFARRRRDPPDDGRHQRHARLHERRRAHGHRHGVGRNARRKSDVHVDRHERQSAADAHRRPRSHRPRERGYRDPARGH